MRRYEVNEAPGNLWILTDRACGSSASILPGFGNQCIRYDWTHEGETIEIIDGPPDLESLYARPMHFGNPILFPFPNRVRDGRFTFRGKVFTLPINEVERGHAIHGLVFTRPWEVVATGASDEEGAWITCRFESRAFPEVEADFPFPFTLEYTYRLRDGALENEVKATNTGDGPMPMGYGVHPWFKAPFTAWGSRQECRLLAPADKLWELDDLIPTGRIVKPAPERDLTRGPKLGGQEYDDVYAGLTGGGPSHSMMADPGTGIEIVVIADSSFRELVIYAPGERDVVCIEPYTCTTDAFNLAERGVDSGMTVLKPGESYESTVIYQPRAYDEERWPS